jgi:hypothetical protein
MKSCCGQYRLESFSHMTFRAVQQFTTAWSSVEPQLKAKGLLTLAAYKSKSKAVRNHEKIREINHISNVSQNQLFFPTILSLCSSKAGSRFMIIHHRNERYLLHDKKSHFNFSNLFQKPQHRDSIGTTV